MERLGAPHHVPAPLGEGAAGLAAAHARLRTDPKNKRAVRLAQFFPWAGDMGCCWGQKRPLRSAARAHKAHCRCALCEGAGPCLNQSCGSGEDGQPSDRERPPWRLGQGHLMKDSDVDKGRVRVGIERLACASEMADSLTRAREMLCEHTCSTATFSSAPWRILCS